MNKLFNQFFVLLLITVIVHFLYVSWIIPNVEMIEKVALESNALLPRNFFIIVKDLEQKICIILFFWGLYLAAQMFYMTSNQSYLFDVDFLKGFEEKNNDIEETLMQIEALPLSLSNSPLVPIISSALRRYIITGSVQSASESISPGLEALAVKNEAELSVIRYVAWAIPSIGFLGTVRGIGLAMSQAQSAVEGNIGPMTQSLGVAFNSTFVALLASIVIMLMLSFLQRSQDEQLVRVRDYCENYLIKRISSIKKK